MPNASGPSITVATVALNAGRDLPLTIESILGQTYPHVQTLVLDGYSWDETHVILERYRNRLDLIESLEDGGIYQAMNAAAAKAQGDFILFLNAGDRFYSADAIAAIAERMQDDADVVYGDHIYVDGREERLVHAAPFDWLWQCLRDGHIDQDWHISIPGHQATFTRTRLLREMPYDTRYRICADHDFLFKARARGARLQYVDEIVSHYLAGGMSGAQGQLIHREWAHAYRKHSLRPLAVDSFFFGSPQASLFPSFTSGSGGPQSGAEPETRSEDGQRWRWIDGLDLRAPAHCETVGMHLRGVNQTAGQTLVITCEEDLLGAEKLAYGEFEQCTAFLVPIAPGAEIRMHTQVGNAVGAPTGCAIGALHFIACPVLAGTYLDLFACDPMLASEVFLDGWQALELNAENGYGRVWSNVEQASFAMATLQDVETLILHLEPHSAMRQSQDLTVVINGELAARVRLQAAGGPVILRIPVSRSWRHGANIVRLCLDQLARDKRTGTTFGIGLSKIEWQ